MLGRMIRRLLARRIVRGRKIINRIQRRMIAFSYHRERRQVRRVPILHWGIIGRYGWIKHNSRRSKRNIKRRRRRRRRRREWNIFRGHRPDSSVALLMRVCLLRARVSCSTHRACASSCGTLITRLSKLKREWLLIANARMNK
jgi:hypothetical protein